MSLDAFFPRECLCSRNALARVDFGSIARQKTFFRQARRCLMSGKNLFIQVSKITSTDVTFRKLKRWSLGQALPALDVVVAICNLTGQEFGTLGVKIMPSHWGQEKGGTKKFAQCGCNLTLLDRMKGGRLTGRSNSILHMKAIASIGGSKSITNRKHPFRKIDGPNGIRMFNRLERDVMTRLVGAGYVAEYEPVVKIGSRRLIPDFRVGITYIECTRNTKVNAKAAELRERFRLLRGHVAFRRGIVVTLPFLVDRYRLHLPRGIGVATPQDLPSVIA